MLQHGSLVPTQLITWTLADVFRKLREEKGWRQAELAGHAQLHRTTVTELETGRVEPDPETQRRIARALGVTLGQVYAYLDQLNLLLDLEEPERQTVLALAERLKTQGIPQSQPTTADLLPSDDARSAAVQKTRGRR